MSPNRAWASDGNLEALHAVFGEQTGGTFKAKELRVDAAQPEAHGLDHVGERVLLPQHAFLGHPAAAVDDHLLGDLGEERRHLGRLSARARPFPRLLARLLVGTRVVAAPRDGARQRARVRQQRRATEHDFRLAKEFDLLVSAHVWGAPNRMNKDGYTRLALILAGAFGAYSLGANNIANVMGVFVPVAPFPDILFGHGFSISSAQQLFLVGGLAIAVGVFTYSKRVMMTVGSELMTLTPLAAWVAVMSHSIVLFLFASERLEQLLAKMSLPTIPLVPVSSSQAVVGAVIGIGMLQGGREIQWPRVYSIVKGWVITPLISCLLCFVGLYFLQNVFQQKVQRNSNYMLSASVIEKLQKEGIETEGLHDLTGTIFHTSAQVVRAVKDKVSLSSKQGLKVVEYSLQKSLIVTAEKIADLETNGLSSAQLDALSKLVGQTYNYPWQLGDALAEISPEWIMLGRGLKDKLHDRDIKQELAYIYRNFQRRER